MSQLGDRRVTDLLQAGQLRTALFLPQFTKDPTTNELHGLGTGHLAQEITRALAARLGVKAQWLGYPTPSSVVECLQAGACDMAFLGIESARAAVLDFSPAIFQFDFTCLVPAGSTIRAIRDADRPGVRIAVVLDHASTLTLRQIVRMAQLVGAKLPDAAFELLRAGHAEAFALPRDVLLDYSLKLPGSTVLEDAYGVNNVGIAIKKGQAERLAYINEFVEEAKASGLIQQVIENGNLRGFRVAPRG
jgi:polar amino acid transport system substrate-binding protein